MSARVAALAASLVLLAACGQSSVSSHTSAPPASPSPSPSPPPAVGDACVVGTWTLSSERNVSGYTWNSKPVSVSGLQGATLTITAPGDETEVFAGSQPLEGTVAGGGNLRITIRGSYDFQIKFANGQYTETGSTTQLPTTATLNGKAVQYHSSYQPGSGTYTCAAGSLTMTTVDGVQTDNWSKG